MRQGEVRTRQAWSGAEPARSLLLTRSIDECRDPDQRSIPIYRNLVLREGLRLIGPAGQRSALAIHSDCDRIGHRRTVRTARQHPWWRQREGRVYLMRQMRWWGCAMGQAPYPET